MTGKVKIGDREIALKPLSQGAWAEIRKKFKGDDDETRLGMLIEALAQSAASCGGGTKQEYLELFNSLPIGELGGPLGVRAMAILTNEPEEIIELKTRKAELERLREKKALEAEIRQLENEIRTMGGQSAA